MKKGLTITGAVIVLLPIILNWVMRQPQIVPYVGETKDWLTFWGDYLSAAVASIMIVFTYFSLKNNKETLNEMKREWEEERKARLSISIVANDSKFMIRIKNIGKLPAYNIQMGFNKEFVDSLFAAKIRNTYKELLKKNFTLDAGESKYFYLSPIYSHHVDTYQIGNETFHAGEINKWLDSFRHKLIIIEAHYNDKEFTHYETTLDDYLLSNLVVKDDITQQLTALVKGTVKNNNQYYPIQKSLDIIAKHIEKQKSIIMDDKVIEIRNNNGESLRIYKEEQKKKG